jgi:hypothetical protein
MITDNDFVLIFQNSNVFNSVYRFIEVVSFEATTRSNKACIRDAPIQHLLVYEQQNPCNMCLKAADGQLYTLNVGAPCDKGHMYGATKADWVNKARTGFLFDNHKKYLCCKSGQMGIADLIADTFVPFLSNTGVYVFFYRMMQLSDKPLTDLRYDKWEDEDEHCFDNDYDIIDDESDMDYDDDDADDDDSC